MNNQDEMFYMEVGKRIRSVRLSKKMSQSELAAKAHISLTLVSSIENGRSGMLLVTFSKIAEALEVSADSLLRLDVPESNPIFANEFAEILRDCSASEAEAILKISKELKETFTVQKNKLLD